MGQLHTKAFKSLCGRTAGMLLLHEAVKTLGQFRCAYGKPFNTAGEEELEKSFTGLHPTLLKTLSTSRR